MTKYYLGSDSGGSSDEQCLEEIKTTLESANHEVQMLGITSDLESPIVENCKEGEIALYGVNGFCIGTIDSVNKAAKKHNFNVIFFTMESSDSEYCKEPGYSSKKVDMAHDDGFSDASVRAKYGGNKYTPKEIVDQMSNVSFVPWQGSCSAQAEGIMNGVTGSNNSSSGESSIMSGWESLCDLLKPLDGLAMMLQRGDTVIVKKITVPEEDSGDASSVSKSKQNIGGESSDESESDELSNENEETAEEEYVSVQTVTTKTGVDNPTVDDNLHLYAYEGVNIVEDSVTVTNYTPEIYNTLLVKWGENYENEFTLCFEKHKELYGERLKEVEACNKETVPDDDSEEDEQQNNDENNENSGNNNSNQS